MKEFSYGIIPVFKKIDGSYEILLIRQHENYWGFPKGHAEEDETALQTAKRELEEEVNISDLTVKKDHVFTQYYEYTFEGEKREKTVKYFLGFVHNKKVKIQEAELIECKWIDFDQAMEFITIENAKQILEEVKKILSKHQI